MTTTLIIVRHGNTFTAEQTPTRVGGRTDLPLVPSGHEQAKQLATYMQAHDISPDAIYTGPLVRHKETAQGMIDALDLPQNYTVWDAFTEIDYGPDENMTEDVVVARIGQQAINDWNADAKVPDGWVVDPEQIIQDWQDFAKHCEAQHQGQTIMLFSSNGVIRFAPHLTGDFDGFAAANKIKVSTGALCTFVKSPENENWSVSDWNVKPRKWLAAQTEQAA